MKSSRLVPIENENRFGKFFSSESYVLKYTWEHKEKPRCLFYIWHGTDCMGVIFILLFFYFSFSFLSNSLFFFLFFFNDVHQLRVKKEQVHY